MNFYLFSICNTQHFIKYKGENKLNNMQEKSNESTPRRPEGERALDAQILFITDQQLVEMNKGQLVVLHEHIPHSVKAKSEAVFLLSMAIK